ncbi:elongator complex protein 6 [Chrysoperla carnea]|uniref:elongator complex protein 6 n=1 Tax=Chrysoperla carnea TaxID=189513 RepID=UPI001D068F6B|nr:elongator complex protein 6 [Chrysoperla carnea]
MASEVIAALELDKSDINNKLLIITERNDANSSFILSCVMSERYNKDSAFLIVTLANTFRHYHNVGMKLGYNLDKLSKIKKLDTIEILQHLSESICNSSNLEDHINFLDVNKTDIIKNLTNLIRFKLNELFRTNTNVCLIIDDISYLLDLNIPVRDIYIFKQNLKNMLNVMENLSIVLSVAVKSQEDLIIANSFRHIGDSVIELSGLKTGKSDLVTGVMHIRRLNEDLKSWGAQNIYHYKLLDRQIRIFAPGTANTIV